MSRWWWLWCLAVTPAVSAEGILDVLQRSHAQRLEQLSDARRGTPSPEAVRSIELSFARLTERFTPDRPPGLRVVRGEALAETLGGRLIVVDESVAALTEGQRLFVLAHELGHVALGHWGALGRLYQRHIPGEVLRSQTDAVAALLGREASALAHEHEYAADAWALAALRALGHGPTDVESLFARFGPSRDTPTHPGTRRRLAQLRAIEVQAAME